MIDTLRSENRKTAIYDYRVLPREVDFTLKATLFTMGDNILHTAGEDADRFGFGITALQSRDMAWVLSRMAIEMERYPVQDEFYSVETWVEEINRLMTTRNFILRDAQGNRIGAASTCWAMIDFETRKPLDLSRNTEYLRHVNPIPCPIERPIRINSMEGAAVETRTVRYSDVDFNCHTNSMRYLQWMVDTLPLDQLTHRSLHRVDLNFVHETRYGEEILLFCDHSGDEYRFEVKSADKTACKALLKLE